MAIRSSSLVLVPVSISLIAPLPTPAAAQADPVRCLVIDSLSQNPTLFDGLSAEARALLATAGVRTEWRPAAPDAAARDAEALVIVLPEAPGAHPLCTLGAAVAEEGVARAGWVYAGPVARLLGLDIRRKETWSPHEARAFARALGRVAAHELVHVFLPELPHSRSGLMRASLRAQDLVGGAPAVDGTTRVALRHWLIAELPASASSDRLSFNPVAAGRNPIP